MHLGRITILLDDLHPERRKEFKALEAFIAQYPNVRYIICLDSELVDVVAQLTPEFPIAFKKVFVHTFTRNKLRRLVEKWGADETRVEVILEQIITDLVQINVPLTGVTGSIFLTIFDKLHDFKPINRAVLISQFVETLLGKHAPEEAFRDTFDYVNKSHYLGCVSEFLVRADLSAVPREDLREVTKRYMHDFGFNRKPDEIIDLFISARIFSDKGGSIGFTYRAFLEYFVAVRMHDDVSFCEYVLHESRYLSFPNEIEYYSGLRRGELSLIELLGKRMNEITTKIKEQDQWSPDLTLFSKFRLQKGPEHRVIAEVQQALKLPALSDEERDAVLEGEIPRDVGRRQDVFRPIFEDDGARWLAALVLASKVVRNSELVHRRIQ
jgi:hypothetical protein